MHSLNSPRAIYYANGYWRKMRNTGVGEIVKGRKERGNSYNGGRKRIYIWRKTGGA